jgi:hypothetical protein
MIDLYRRFEYPRSERITHVSLFLLALLLPILVEVLAFVFLVSFPPRHTINTDLFIRLVQFYPRFVGNNSASVLILTGSSWLLVIAVTLPNAITHSLVISVGSDCITATLCGLWRRCLSWNDIEQIERFSIHESDGIAWRSINSIRLVSRKGRITVRQTISEFPEFLRIIVLHSEKHGIPIVAK